MSYKIVVDSCCELPETYKNDSRFQSVPLGLEVGDYVISDDESFNQKEFLKKVSGSALLQGSTGMSWKVSMCVLNCSGASKKIRSA